MHLFGHNFDHDYYFRLPREGERETQSITRCSTQLLLENRFPQIWVPSWENRDVRQLLWHRHRMVQARTRIMNQLQAVALNEGLLCKKRLWRDAGRNRISSASWRSVFCLRTRFVRISAASPIHNSNFSSASNRSNQRACPLASIPTRAHAPCAPRSR